MMHFVDTELQKQRKLIADLDRESYLKYLENDYYQRVIAEHGEEAGYFGRVGLPAQGNITADSGPKLLE
jgi:hypothetical protein